MTTVNINRSFTITHPPIIAEALGVIESRVVLSSGGYEEAINSFAKCDFIFEDMSVPHRYARLSAEVIMRIRLIREKYCE